MSTIRGIGGIFVAIFAMSMLHLGAQDIHFSQFYAAPLELNPALTGVFNCTQRLTANYRNQGASIANVRAYNTYAASYDHKIPVGRADYFGVGAIFTGDVAGSLDFGTISGRLSGSYSKQLYSSYESTHYLVVGAAGGVSQRSLDWSASRWGLQHDGMGGFNPDGPSEGPGDNLDADFLFADFNVGLLYFTTFNQGESSLYAGFAANHINRADVSIYIEDSNGNEVFNPLYTRYTVHAGGIIGMRNGMAFVPGAVFMSQGPTRQLNIGTALRFDLGGSRYNEQFAQFGVWTRIADRVLLEGNPDDANPLVSGEETDPWVDAIILYTKFDFNQFGIGFSYDLGVSDLQRVTNSNNAFEFSLMYKICRDERRGVYCPKF